MGRVVTVERITYVCIGTVAVMAGFVCLLGYAIPWLEDFSYFPFTRALMGSVPIWVLAISAFYVGYRYLRRLF
jgi:hypothetical protein